MFNNGLKKILHTSNNVFNFAGIKKTILQAKTDGNEGQKLSIFLEETYRLMTLTLHNLVLCP